MSQHSPRKRQPGKIEAAYCRYTYSPPCVCVCVCVCECVCVCSCFVTCAWPLMRGHPIPASSSIVAADFIFRLILSDMPRNKDPCKFTPLVIISTGTHTHTHTHTHRTRHARTHTYTHPLTHTHHKGRATIKHKEETPRYKAAGRRACR